VVTWGAYAPALRRRVAPRATARLAIHRWSVNARILLDHLIATGVVVPRVQPGVGGQALPEPAPIASVHPS
jgi:hypothetical protein